MKDTELARKIKKILPKGNRKVPTHKIREEKHTKKKFLANSKLDRRRTQNPFSEQ